MDFGALPPGISSARRYFGRGSATLLATASDWSGLTERLQSMASAVRLRKRSVRRSGHAGA